MTKDPQAEKALREEIDQKLYTTFQKKYSETKPGQSYPEHCPDWVREFIIDFIPSLSSFHKQGTGSKSAEEMAKLQELLQFSDRYDISVQFWTDQTAVYIEKSGVDLIDYGGDFLDVMQRSIDYLNRITNTK